MPELLEHLLVVLVRPRFPENIGAAARAVANFGLGGLRVVAPERLWEKPMRRLATEAGAAVLEGMEVFPDLESALADCAGAAATTARRGERRGQLLPPRQAAPAVLALTAGAPGARAALVFGPEDRGLDNRELNLCQLSICIPTTDNASLNLAQAVVVLAYELRVQALAARGRGHPSRPARAPLGEVHALYRHLRQAMDAIGVFRGDNPEHFFRPFQQVLDRAGLTSREVRSLHGLARQVLWLKGELDKAGLEPDSPEEPA